MDVTADVAGGETHDLSLDPGATYADLLEGIDLHREEATVLVDGRPVPSDASVAAASVRVVRLVRGG